MIYREVALPDALRSIALCGWLFSLEEADPPVVEHSVPPDGSTNLLLTRSDKGELFPRQIGPSLAAVRFPVAKGWTFAGLRLRPEAAAAVTGQPPAVAESRPLPLDGPFAPLWPDLSDLMDGRTDWARSAALIVQPPGDEAVALAVDLLIASGGTIGIGEVAARLGLGERQFRRRFHAATGLSPKQYAAIQRVRRALILSLEEPNWAEIAYETGFADQPHLARDIKERFGAAPARVSGYIGRIRHDFVTFVSDRFVQDDRADAA